RFDDGELWLGQAHPAADAGTPAHAAAGAVRQLLANGSAVVFGRGVVCLRAIRGLRGACRGAAAVFSEDVDTRGADLARGCDSDLHPEHDLRRAGEALLVSHHSALAFPARA